MIKNIKDEERKGFIKAFLKKDYPSYLSKDFSTRVMRTIYAQQKPILHTYILRIASAFVFGIFTIIIMDNIMSEDIQYTKTNIENENMTPSRNVSTQPGDCKNIKDNSSRSDIIECE